MENKEVVRRNVGDQVIARINSLSEVGFTMPKGYSAVNAIKMAMIKLQDVKDKNGKSALEVCTPASIQSSLFKMVTQGLDLSLNQAYAIVRGTNLCIDPSYFGNVLRVRRIYPDWTPVPRVIRKDDKYVTSIDPKTGRKHLVEHQQPFENMDKEFIGGYIILPTPDGEGELYEMTAKAIKTAWSKSSNHSLTVHKDFDEKMVGKTLINSGCTKIINSTPELRQQEEVATNGAVDEEINPNQIEQHNDYTEFEEVSKEEQSKEQPAQTEEPKKQPKAKAEPKKEEFEDNDEF